MNSPMAERAGSAVAWNATQLVLSKLISLGRYLVLARLIAPDAFGLLAIAAVVVELVIALSNFGIDQALIQKETADSPEYDSAWTLRVIRAAAIAAVVAIIAPLLARAFDEPSAATFIRLLALRPLLDAAGSIKLATLARSLVVRPLAALTVSAAALETATAIGLALLLPKLFADAGVSGGSLGAWAIVVGALAGSAGGSALSYVIAPHRPRFTLNRDASAALLRFGRWLFLTSSLGVAGQLLLRLIISQELGVAELGVFYLATKLSLLPNEVAGDVIRSVAFPVVSRVQSDIDRARRAFQSSLTAMLLILVPVYVTMIVLAEPLVLFVLGDEWRLMIPIVRLLAVDGIVDILADATKPLVLGLGHPERSAILKGTRTGVILAVAWPMVAIWGLPGAAGAFLVAETVQFLVAYGVLRRSLPRIFGGMAPRFWAITGAAVAGGVVAWIGYALVSNQIGFLGAALGSAVAAASVLFVADRRHRLGLLHDFLRAFPHIPRALTARIDRT